MSLKDVNVSSGADSVGTRVLYLHSHWEILEGKVSIRVSFNEIRSLPSWRTELAKVVYREKNRDLRKHKLA